MFLSIKVTSKGFFEESPAVFAVMLCDGMSFFCVVFKGRIYGLKNHARLLARLYHCDFE